MITRLIRFFLHFPTWELHKIFEKLSKILSKLSIPLSVAQDSAFFRGAPIVILSTFQKIFHTEVMKKKIVRYTRNRSKKIRS